MALTPNQLRSIIDLIRRDPEARRQIQAALEMEPLLSLPSRFEDVEERLTRLERTVQRLADAQLDSAERLTRLEETVQKLADAQVAMQQQLAILTGEVRKVSTWQFGDEGRRKGEQYQRKIELQALRLLGEGQGGGLARDRVYERINELLARLPDLDLLDDESDPTLADVIWWKGDYYAVVEVSLRVDRLDVLRAARRAETLRQSGVDTLGVVISEEWIADDTEFLAREHSVAWKVGASISPELVAFRRSPGADAEIER